MSKMYVRRPPLAQAVERVGLYYKLFLTSVNFFILAPGLYGYPYYRYHFGAAIKYGGFQPPPFPRIEKPRFSQRFIRIT